MDLLKKISQLFNDLKYFYNVSPSNRVTGISRVVKVLSWHLFLKRVRKLFIGNYLNFKMLYDTSSDGCAYAYFLPYLEYTLFKLIEFSIKKDCVVFDLGSNIGYYPLICSSKQAFVHSFEPNHDIVKLQKINLLLNNLESFVTVNETAVSNKNGKATFYLQPKGKSGTSSLNYNINNQGNKITVNTITLDSYIKENKINKVDFIKIDVEGAEYQVFLGAAESLKLGVIKCIYWESNKQYSKDERYKVIDLLTVHGFEHFAEDEKTEKVRKWKYGDSNCISIHKSEINNFKSFLK